MALYKINVSYDGTDFHGYQRQTQLRTVQSEIEKALARLGWSEESILSSGRTDTGVHADGQVAVFEFEWKHSDEDLKKALNSTLPADVSIREISHVRDGFHPRYDAKSRIYRYQIYLSPTTDPIKDRFSWRVWPKLDYPLIGTAEKLFLGSHDFRMFGKPYYSGGRTERFIEKVECLQDENEYIASFQIQANSFLYHMVRRIVFILVRVGQGKIEPGSIKESFEGINNLPPGIAPAKGLFLEEIIY